MASVLTLTLSSAPNAGAQWVRCNGPDGYQIGLNGVAVSGTNLFAGTTWEGVYRSTDGGTSWFAANNGLPSFILSVAKIGTNLFAGAANEAGIFLSTDSGASWKAVNSGLKNATQDVSSFAGIGSNIFAGTGYGVYLSTNNGSSWTPDTMGIGAQSVTAFAVSGTNLFAGTSGGVFLSTDSGASWTAASTGLPTRGYLNVTAFAVSVTNLFVASDSGVFLSTNHGGNWIKAGLTDTAVYSLAVSGTNLFAGAGPMGSNTLGVYISTNDGQSWTSESSGLLTGYNFTSIAVSGTTLFAGTWSAGAFLSTNNGTSWTAVNSGLPGPCEVNCFAVNGPNLFAGTGYGGVFLSSNDGNSWTAINSGFPLLYPVNALQVLGTNLLAATDIGVFRSTDNGTNWSKVTDTAVSAFAVIGSILFARSDDVIISSDSGLSWTTVGNTGLHANYYHQNVLVANGVNLFIVDALSTDSGSSWSSFTDSGSNAFAFMGMDFFAGSNYGIYLSTNNGTSWKAANSGYPKLSSVNVNAIETVGANIFAGGISQDSGGVILLSSDSGASWASESLGMPVVRIDAFAVVDDNLFAGGLATTGVPGGVFRRPLSQMIASSSVAEPQTSSLQIQSYPNPLSQSTTIRFTSPESGVARVTVVNLLGEEVARVFEGALPSGEHSFVWSKPPGLPAGMYECVVQMSGSVQQVPMVVTFAP